MLLFVFITFSSSFYLAQSQITNDSFGIYVKENIRNAILNVNLTNKKCSLDMVYTFEAAGGGEMWAVKCKQYM